MRILGVDPGLDATGYGIIEIGERGAAPILIEAGLIRTRASQALPQRLSTVAQEIGRLFAQFQPGFMAVEDLYSHYKTPKPAILMGHVRGVILIQAASRQIPVASYLPTRIKKSLVGGGHASKEQVARMVRVRLNLNEEGEVPADVTDALAVALCHVDAVKSERFRVRDRG